ncbi:hypothetical protein AB8U03_15400 [Clostridium sp. Mt-5]|uniref:Uncharacterized protein n=1 Tax=Clostridium moutaii TaxID=3240932 RepID=A0ABV4BRZ2_9CLOT
MDESTERRTKKAVELYFSGYSAKEAVEQARHWNMDNEAQVYNEDTGEIYKDAEMLTDAELKEFLKNI